MVNGRAARTDTHVPVVIIGGGAAGLMCAIEAGRRGRHVLVIEHANRVGKKILMSGGGRCNFTNLHCAPDRFLSENPHFAKSALALYTPQHFLELVNRYGIAWHEKTLGQLFCDHSSRAVLDMLLAELKNKPQARDVNWDKVDAFRRYGGIRIEDDVVCTDGAPENLTRDAFAAA